MATIEPIRWHGDHLGLLDQRALPAREIWLRFDDAHAVAGAIRDMVVRGAPAIGITAAYGAALAARQVATTNDTSDWDGSRWQSALAADLDVLAASRPTAVNLFWALERVRESLRTDRSAGRDVPARLAALACQLHAEDVAANHRMGDSGAALIEPASVVYTHCNTGALATGGYGTALGVIRSAWRDGKISRVLAGETRPWWQGARLTAWELLREGIPSALCADGAAAHLIREQQVRWVIVGADRIAANGDVANKIGTFTLAVLARQLGARFMVAAPRSTFDLAIPDGSHIPIEQRGGDELTHVRGEPLAPAGCIALNPAFDVTPASLIDVIVTEAGIIERPDSDRVAAHFAAAERASSGAKETSS